MKPLKYLEERIRGWVPKDSVKVCLRKISKPVWWRPLWTTVLILTIASGILAFFMLHMPFQQVVTSTAFAFVCIGIAYYIRVKPSFKVNRALYVLLGITPIGLLLCVAYALTVGHYVFQYLGVWPDLVVTFTVPFIIGAFIGDWIGKRRNYQLPLQI